MGNKVYQPFVSAIWPILWLAVSGLTACSSADIPATATPDVIESTATPTTPTATATTALATSTVPPNTPTPRPTATPAPTTPAPDALIHQGNTLPFGSPITSPTPGTPSAAAGVPCEVSLDTLQLRIGPDANFASSGTLAAGTELSALKTYEADDLWILVETGQGKAGWVNATALSCQSNVSRLPRANAIDEPAPTASALAAVSTPTARPTTIPLPTATPMPTASPTLSAPSLTSWRGEYYDNPNLDGQPVLVRDDPTLDFNWGAAGPDPSVPADYFSVRWTRPFEFTEEGDYRFMADVDDGVKLYLDGWLLIDEWNTNPYMLHSGAFGDIGPGVHTVVVEYFEDAGDAHINVWFEKTLVSADKWVGEYYNNPEFLDAPFLVREDDDVDFDWDDDEPVPGMNSDYFSVRWQKTVKLNEGDYEFRAKLAEEDRVRVYLDNWLVFGEASHDGGTSKGTFKDVGAGRHTITVEYQDYGGEAGIEVDWDRRD